MHKFRYEVALQRSPAEHHIGRSLCPRDKSGVDITLIVQHRDHVAASFPSCPLSAHDQKQSRVRRTSPSYDCTLMPFPCPLSSTLYGDFWPVSLRRCSDPELRASRPGPTGLFAEHAFRVSSQEKKHLPSLLLLDRYMVCSIAGDPLSSLYIHPSSSDSILP